MREWRSSGPGEVLSDGPGHPALAYVQSENGGAWCKLYEPPGFASFDAPAGVDVAKAWALEQLPPLVVEPEVEAEPKPRKRKAAE